MITSMHLRQVPGLLFAATAGSRLKGGGGGGGPAYSDRTWGYLELRVQQFAPAKTGCWLEAGPVRDRV